MKTIEEAAIEHVKNLFFESSSTQYLCKGDFTISFIEGVEFAQRWIQIDRCTNGYITAHSLSDIERNLPVIMNDEDGDKDDEYIIIKYISDLLDMDESFTHWRPIELK